MRGCKLAFITGSYFPERCGVSHYTQNLRGRLLAAGLDSVVLTTREAADSVADSQVRGIVEGWASGCLPPLVQALRREPPDLLHIQFAQGSYRFRRSILLLPFLLRITGFQKPIVTTLHEYGSWDWRPPYVPKRLTEYVKGLGQRCGWWERETGFLLTMSDAVISTHSNTDRILRERIPEIMPRVKTVPLAPNLETDAIDKQAARQELRQAFGWESTDTVFCFFGFVHPVKGLENLLQAFAKLREANKSTRLLIIGGAESLALPRKDAEEYQASLTALVRQLNLDKSVSFTGYLANRQVSCYLYGSDIGVLPFNHGVDLKSGSLLALLSHGLPTIVTHPSHTVESLKAGGVVEVVPPRDVEALGNALLKLLKDPALRQRYSVRGMDFSRGFSWEPLVQAHLSIYRSLLSEPAYAPRQR